MYQRTSYAQVPEQTLKTKFIASTFNAYELLERKEVAPTTFACLHKFQNDVIMLRLIRSDGSVVDPTCQGYVLHNYIWNSNVPPIRAGGEIYFIMKKMEAYSLSHLNNQVWEYGEKPEPPHATTVAEQVECTRINKAAGVFVENYNCKAVKLAHSQGVEILSPGGIFASETMMGMNVNPSEWDPELFIPCQY